jgi:Icc-related predicted phosphoesterase
MLIGTGIPILFTGGNHESNHHVQELRAQGATYLATDSIVIDGVGFCGVPFMWDEDITKEIIQVQVDFCLRVKNKVDRLVLVTHMPPKGYYRPWAPDRGKDSALASIRIRRLLDQTRPHLTICGHLHTDKPHEMNVGGHRVVNPGPDGALIDV